MFCEYCDEVTVEKLVDLRKLIGKKVDSFPEKAYLAHHPSFESLVNAATAGCKLCKAIRREFLRSGGREILDRQRKHLDTSVGLCIGATGDPWLVNLVFDRLLVKIGVKEAPGGTKLLTSSDGDVSHDSSDEEQKSRGNSRTQFEDDEENQNQEGKSCESSGVDTSDSGSDVSQFSRNGRTVTLSLTRHQSKSQWPNLGAIEV
jgi:hypothetical protein